MTIRGTYSWFGPGIHYSNKQHIILGRMDVLGLINFSPRWKAEVIFPNAGQVKRVVHHRWFVKMKKKGCRQILFVGLRGRAAMMEDSIIHLAEIIHKLEEHLLHLASATRPWHCLLKVASGQGAVAAMVSIKHHRSLHLCSHLTEKIKTIEMQIKTSWHCRSVWTYDFFF